MTGKGEHPILFSAPMVLALLAGTKTQTRRTCNHPGLKDLSYIVNCGDGWWGDEEGDFQARCPYGQPGDRLWVRETWQAVSGNDRARHIMTHPRPDRGWLEYAATPRDDEPAYKWRPSIHMPRWASRITLEVTGVRVERLQGISEADAIAEGVEQFPDGKFPNYLSPSGYAGNSVSSYRTLWESINGPGTWNANPWVWLVEFKKL